MGPRLRGDDAWEVVHADTNPSPDPSPDPSTEAFGLAQDEAGAVPSCWAARSACRSMRQRLGLARLFFSRPQCIPKPGTIGPAQTYSIVK